MFLQVQALVFKASLVGALFTSQFNSHILTQVIVGIKNISLPVLNLIIFKVSLHVHITKSFSLPYAHFLLAER